MFIVFGYGLTEHRPISEGQDWTAQAVWHKPFQVSTTSLQQQLVSNVDLFFLSSPLLTACVIYFVFSCNETFFNLLLLLTCPDFFRLRDVSALKHSQKSVYSQKRDRTLEIQDFLDSKPQMRDFTKTRETKEQRKKPRRLSFNLLFCSCFSFATYSHNINPSHHCLLRNLMSGSFVLVMSLQVNVWSDTNASR